MKYHIKPEIDVKNHRVTFYIDQPDNYTVEFNKNVKRAVHIFANEIEENVPKKDDKNVLYIGPGEWNIENIVLEDGKTVYVSGGAVVHGIINANFASNVKVRGRGIIDGSGIRGWKGRTPRIPLKFDNCTNISVEGICALNANAWCFQAYDTIGGKIDGLKIITSRPNGDGISLQSCKSFKVQNGFVRTWDDSLVVKNYDENSTNIRFKNMQIWTDLAQSMEIGYETNKGQKENSKIEDISFEDITVLHNFHKPVLSIHNADDALITNINYKNIVVEDASVGQGDGTPQLIDLGIVQNSSWSATRERGTIDGVTIDGFKVLYGNKFLPSKVEGYDDSHKVKNVTMKGLKIKGKAIKSLEDGGIEVNPLSTENIAVK
ncbi:MAG: glycoside hydrolase family 28 protein [Eubacterium sp.]|nr:glycoside hydrolase family 28 protein [Eubacterium sp.]